MNRDDHKIEARKLWDRVMWYEREIQFEIVGGSDQSCIDALREEQAQALKAYYHHDMKRFQPE